ncbi:MAG: pyruvate dehydrogenase (acetyl-transferring), homodimeric type [bacterium]|nr:pyruvate dehydrogenase (acetyl-transferring), homodimeric type [bacterium]
MDRPTRHQDIDPQETREWIESLQSVLEREGPERAHFLIEQLADNARRSGLHLPFKATTAYVNTIHKSQEAQIPGDPDKEARILALVRWNAMAMVVGANRENEGIGGHIASYASIATLYEVGFNHFFRAPTDDQPGDLVFFQGHSSPGVYARSFLEGRISQSQLQHFRRETGGEGLPSYPHPHLMPGYWQFPTVSMGLGPLQAIYQARFMKYLEHRGLLKPGDRKVWAFLGDGEMDEPESVGALALAAREKLDNLIFVINCNLQRLDGPVRGNGKIIQELEADFRGHGWRVFKVLWGRKWDELFAKDHSGKLRERLEEAVDGDFQNYVVKGGAFAREHFFGKYPETKELVANLSDQEIWHLERGGHDPQKVYASYAEAVKPDGRPTVILAKTVKGFGMGEAGEGQNITHQQKKMGESSLKAFRDRFNIPIDDKDLLATPFYRPDEDGDLMVYLRQQREKLGGFVPQQICNLHELDLLKEDFFTDYLAGGKEGRAFSTTMAMVQMLTKMLRDQKLGPYLVPIVPDEARTFGMENLFRQVGIYSSSGQDYEPPDSDQVMYYKESQSGQILEEGITEAGALADWIAAGTARCNHGLDMVPFFFFYSMFGFQRVGDLIWAGADAGARGFLLGGTAGRTTLNGEGLQHQDGQSQLMASYVPSCISYDPAYSYELAVIVREGMRRMYKQREEIFYYITLYNENYEHPSLPEGVEEDILLGLYRLKKAGDAQVELIGSGSILREVERAARLLEEDFGLKANLWSATSFTELKRSGENADRWNRLHPDQKPRSCHLARCLEQGLPVVAASDFVKTYPEQIRPWVRGPLVTLGTDGFGRSDTREALREHFEVDAQHVVLAALDALIRAGSLGPETLAEGLEKYQIDPEKPNPSRS